MNKFDYTVFIDADASIFNVKVKDSFLQYFLLETIPSETYATQVFEKYLKNTNQNLLNGVKSSLLNKNYFKNFCGMPSKLLIEIGVSWFNKSKLQLKENFLNQDTLFTIDMHKRSHAQIVLLSCSFFPCINPLLEYLDCNDIICTELEIINGYYTGNIIYDPICYEGKEKALKNYLNNLCYYEDKILSELHNFESLFCDISSDYSEDIISNVINGKSKFLNRN
jgi:hypothetical protein